MKPTIKTREDKARRQLIKQGFSLKKSRVQNCTANNQGGYMIVQNGIIQAGERFDMTLDDVEDFAEEWLSRKNLERDDPKFESQ